jgi:hypothetical protein
MLLDAAATIAERPASMRAELPPEPPPEMPPPPPPDLPGKIALRTFLLASAEPTISANLIFLNRPST